MGARKVECRSRDEVFRFGVRLAEAEAYRAGVNRHCMTGSVSELARGRPVRGLSANREAS